jgi:LysM repeat protein
MQDKYSKYTVQKGNPPTTHLVQPKETLYSISKQYNVTIDELKAANGDLLNSGLKIGQKIKIPASSGQAVATVPAVEKVKEVVKETPKPIVKQAPTVLAPKGKTTFHVIEPKETKYGISKRYGMTIEELEQMNPQILTNFPIGMKLVVSGNAPAVISEKSVTPTVTGIKQKEITPTSSGKKYLQEYVVKPNETILSIANDYGMSESELLELNPELKKGVKSGMIIRVPIITKKQAPVPVPKTDQGQGNLLKNTNTNARKQLALLFPFNISKIESDTINTTQERLKKDKFLNLTLDFYAGALMAIDSAKVLGMNVAIKILDSQETKNTSNVAALVAQNDLATMDAIIGPFYQTNAEKLADLLSTSKTPVISPLSKESGRKIANLYQSMPSTELLRNSIFNYMKAKGGNIIAVVDPKKGSIKQYLQDMQKGIRIVGMSDKGTVVADSLKVLFRKDKLNYVVVASESTSIILATTTAMLNAQKDFQVQMVIMEPNETLDFEEIALNKLTKLKLLYPSLSRPNETVEADEFDAKYKKLNKILPNQYAIRGFDVTFDTLMRLAQDKPFEATVSTASQQIENKFEYTQNTIGGYSNKGIYILYYDEDLTIKEAL